MLFFRNLFLLGFAVFVCSFLSSCVTSSDWADIAVSQNIEAIRADFKGKSREDIGQQRLDQMLNHECSRSFIDDYYKYQIVNARYEVVELLVQKGASPYLAVGCPGVTDLKFVKLLQEKGVNWNRTFNMEGLDYKQNLVLACRRFDAESLAYIRAKGAIFDINEKLYNNDCLFHALGNHNISAVKYLLSIGFNPNKPLGKGKNKGYYIHTLAFSLASKNKHLNHPEMQVLISAGANPNFRNGEGLTATEVYVDQVRHLNNLRIAKKNREHNETQQNEKIAGALFQGLLAGAQEYNKIEGAKNRAKLKSNSDGVTPSRVLYEQKQSLFDSSNNKLPKSPGLTGQVNHTCRSGTKVNIAVTAKTNACLNAKKFMAITYGCNRIDDFKTLKSRCTQACGRQDCAETGG